MYFLFVILLLQFVLGDQTTEIFHEDEILDVVGSLQTEIELLKQDIAMLKQSKSESDSEISSLKQSLKELQLDNKNLQSRFTTIMQQFIRPEDLECDHEPNKWTRGRIETVENVESALQCCHLCHLNDECERWQYKVSGSDPNRCILRNKNALLKSGDGWVRNIVEGAKEPETVKPDIFGADVPRLKIDSPRSYLILSSQIKNTQVSAIVIIRPFAEITENTSIFIEIPGFTKSTSQEIELKPKSGPGLFHLNKDASLKKSSRHPKLPKSMRKTRDNVLILSVNIGSLDSLEPNLEYSFGLEGLTTPIEAAEYDIVVKIGEQSTTSKIEILDRFPPPRLIALGDTHGDIAKTHEALQFCGLTNPDGHWIGGRTNFIQVGDLVDRGPFSYEIVVLMKQLKKEAKFQGGQVELLLGNHEIMYMNRDWRYLHEQDKLRWDSDALIGTNSFSSYVFGDDEGDEDEIIEISVDVEGRAEVEAKPIFEIVKGWFISDQWKVAHMQNETLFVHAGLLPKWAEKGVSYVNNRFRESVLNGMFEDELLHGTGPLWTRRFNRQHSYGCEELKETLQLVGAKQMVIGHNPQTSGKPTRACNGALYLIDVAMSDWMHRPYRRGTGKIAAFQILDGVPSLLVPRN